jgi:uncharacterized protein YjiS (DUF1127 family)
MSQIVTNQTVFHPASSQSHRGTRFVHFVDGVIESAVDGLLTWQRRHRDRIHLMGLDERMLRDIGVSLADVEREASKPFWKS